VACFAAAKEFVPVVLASGLNDNAREDDGWTLSLDSRVFAECLRGACLSCAVAYFIITMMPMAICQKRKPGHGGGGVDSENTVRSAGFFIPAETRGMTPPLRFY